MERLVINIPARKSAFVKKLLKELGVTIETGGKTPNSLTAKTIQDAHSGIGLNGSITDIKDFFKSI